MLYVIWNSGNLLQLYKNFDEDSKSIKTRRNVSGVGELSMLVKQTRLRFVFISKFHHHEYFVKICLSFILVKY